MNTQTNTQMRTRTITADMLDRLPAPVKRYMLYTGVVGRPWIDTARVKYTGKFRMGANKPWMPLSVEQVYTTNPPGFRWKAQFKMAGLPFMFADDVYKAGHGRMIGKVAGLFTVVDGYGDEIDQGTMVRYMQEMTWFPTGYLGENITWQAVDDHAADVTFTDAGKSVTGRMYFDDEGRMMNFAAQRYGEFDGSYAARTWTTPTTEYGMLAGLRLPVAGLGVWLLPSGDLPYVDVRVTELAYNEAIEPF